MVTPVRVLVSLVTWLLPPSRPERRPRSSTVTGAAMTDEAATARVAAVAKNFILLEVGGGSLAWGGLEEVRGERGGRC